MISPSWTLDERTHAGSEHLDPAYVASYERKSGLAAEEELALLHAHGLGPETTLVDLGCGTGLLALAAAPHCRRVVAVDPSPVMTAVVRERMVGVANLELAEAGFLTYEHRGESAQLVHSRNALHHLPDFWKALALDRIRRPVASGGVLVLRDLVYSFEPAETEERLEAWFAGAPADPAAGWTRAELEEHVRAEYSTFSWLLEPLLERAGFAVRDASHRRGAYSTYVCVAR